MNRKRLGFAWLACSLLFILLLFSIFNSFVFAANEKKTTVYLAGNPNLYPIEYYNSKDGKYEGLMPELYDIVSKRTGYTFEYLHPSIINGQKRMVKNSQVDILSAHYAEDVDVQGLKKTMTIATIGEIGTKKNIKIAFTNIASQEVISELSRELSRITDKQKLSILSNYTMEQGINRIDIVRIYVLSFLIVVFIVVILLQIGIIHKKRKRRKAGKLVDARYGIGNDGYYIYIFENLITDKSKSLYYVAYIAFNEESFNLRYGDSESKNVQSKVAYFLNKKTMSTDYLSIVNDGVFVLVYQSKNREEAEGIIKSIIQGLDSYLGQFNSQYTGLFRAGICSLDEHKDCDSEAAFYNAKQGYLYAVNEDISYSFSTKAIVDKNKQKERINHRLTQAIKEEEFKIYLQFIVDRTGKIKGAEAVSRWENPQEGLLTPSKYIDVMNETGTVVAHDYYIFTQTCKLLEAWESKGHGELLLSCNFTRLTLSSTDFVKQIETIASRYAFSFGNLVLEITEHLISHKNEVLQENIIKCKELGFLIALDDMGTGNSTLADLYNYNIDIIKIEKSLVSNAMNPRGRMLLDGLIKLAHSMNILVLCEGIETAEQNKMVLSTECDLIQGFYYSRVLPLREAMKFLS